MGSEEFPIFFHFFSFFFAFSFFFVFLRFSSFFCLFFVFLPILLERGQTTAIYWENGEFHSDPVCTDPVRNFPKFGGNLAGFVRSHKIKAQQFRGKLRSIFRERIRASEKIIRAQRALRDILMSRGKKCLPIVSRQFLTRNYPRPNRLLKCLPNCLSPTGEGIFSSFKITPAVRVIARQLRDKNCPGAKFAPGHQDVSQGPLGANFVLQTCHPNIRCSPQKFM